MLNDPTILVLGRGQVYFDPFSPGTFVGQGERYIGNTPTFRTQRTVNTIPRNTSYGGLRVDQGDEVVSESHSIMFMTDNISMENIGLWYGDGFIQNPQTHDHSTVTEVIPVQRGLYYQLGRTQTFVGARSIAVVGVKVAGIPIPQPNNYEVDAAAGRVRILPAAPNISNGNSVEFKFEWIGQRTRQIVSEALEVEGSLRYISRNSHGPQRHYWYPRVRLSPQGQIDLKGDEWQQIVFTATVLRLGPQIEQVYIDEAENILLDADEMAVLDAMIRLSDFPPLENTLDLKVDATLGEHGY